MSSLSQKDLDIFANRILEDYDAKNPSTIFKEKKRLSNKDALNIQSIITKLRLKRGEEVIGYKIGCVLKDTQKKWVLLNLLGGASGIVNCIQMSQYCIKKITAIQQWRQNLV